MNSPPASHAAAAAATSAAAATAPEVTRPKSPPLAFEKTPNDALFAPAPDFFNHHHHAGSSGSQTSPSNMGRRSPLSPATEHEVHLQVLVDQQASAIQLLHDAFAAERQAWSLERERLFQRIASLEQLLKSGNHYSPAKSPLQSPSSAGIVSPSSRAVIASQVLPTITEDENIRPLSSRREGAPRSIQMPSSESRRASAITFTDSDGFKVEEIPITPGRATNLSPPPPNNRMLAGHTPSKVPRPPTPPPQKMALDGIEDTPTRNNTHINTLLTQSNEKEEDPELKGPLNMPELPHQPDATNFTLEMLSKKLEQIEKHPEHSRPMVFKQPTPGVASPVSEHADNDAASGSGAKSVTKDEEMPFAPAATEMPQSVTSSNARSPLSVMSPQEVHEARVHTQFEQGGIRLKKKASVNFGAPFGTLAGFAAPRRLSQDQ